MNDEHQPISDQHSPAEHTSSTSPLFGGPLAIAPTVTPYTPALHLDEINERSLVIDTETTGRSQTSEIIEVAVCDVDGRMLYESLVRPTAEVPRAAARIHRLTTEQLSGAPTWNLVWAELGPVIQGRVLIAYNAGFDRRMLELMCACYRAPRPDVRWRCALQFVKEQAGLRRAPTLSAACERYGVAPGTHRAATDALATAALLRQIKHLAEERRG